MPNDYKIENESFWYEPLDDFQASHEIVVVEMCSPYCVQVLIYFGTLPINLTRFNCPLAKSKCGQL